MDGVRELMSTHVFDVLALSETWLSPNITDNEVDIPEYTVVLRKDRTGSAKLNGGGVSFYVRENSPFTVKNDLAAKNEELLWIEINRPKCKPLLIAAAYKPPHQLIAAVYKPPNSPIRKKCSVMSFHLRIFVYFLTLLS